MKIYIQLIILLLSVGLLSSCGQSMKEKTSTTLEIVSGALTVSGGALMVYGVESTRNRFVAINASSDPTLTFENGNWKFYILHYDGPTMFSGTLRCGVAQATLSGGEQNLAIAISKNSCSNLAFGPSAFFNVSTLQPYPLTVSSCLHLGSLTNGNSSCSATAGESLSFQIALLDTLPSSVDFPIIAGNAAESDSCHNFSSSQFVTSEKIPLGSSQLPIPFGVRLFSGVNCTGTQKDFEFPKGLFQSTATSAIYNNISSKYASLYLKDGSALPLTALVGSATLPSMTNIDMFKLVSGGVKPYTYGTSGPGSVNTNLFHASGAGSTTVTVTDQLGDSVSMTLTTVMPSMDYNFSNSLPANWSLTNSFTTSTFVNSSGNLSTTGGASIPRFNYVEQSGSFISEGLLLESESTNLIQNSANIGSWITTNMTPPTLLSPEVNPSGGTGNVYQIADNTTGSQSFLNYNDTALAAGDYTFSIYLKKESSNIALVYFSIPAVNCTDLLVDLQNGLIQNGPFCGSSQKGIQKLSNGWYRVWVKNNLPSTANINIRIWPALNTTFLPSEDITATGSILAYGAQLEKKPFATSYIATSGAALTRTYDQLINNASLATSVAAQGTFLFDLTLPEVSQNAIISSTVNIGTSDSYEVGVSSGGAVNLYMKNAGTPILTSTSLAQMQKGFNKIGYSYSNTKATLSVNGGNTQDFTITGATTTIPTGGQWRIGNRSSLNDPLNGSIMRAQYYATPISPVILKILTAP